LTFFMSMKYLLFSDGKFMIFMILSNDTSRTVCLFLYIHGNGRNIFFFRLLFIFNKMLQCRILVLTCKHHYSVRTVATQQLQLTKLYITIVTRIHTMINPEWKMFCNLEHRSTSRPAYRAWIFSAQLTKITFDLHI